MRTDGKNNTGKSQQLELKWQIYLISRVHFRMSRVVNLFPELRNDHRIDDGAYLKFSDEAEADTATLDRSSTLPIETLGQAVSFLAGHLSFWATN
jgi:hypothetical protein